MLQKQYILEALLSNIATHALYEFHSCPEDLTKVVYHLNPVSEIVASLQL